MAFEFAPGALGPVRVRESIVAGEAPAGLVEGELALNSADNVLYHKDGQFPGAVGFSRIVTITQAAYDALAVKDATTLYIVTAS